MISFLKKTAAVFIALTMTVFAGTLTSPGFSSSAAENSATWPVPESYKNITTYFDPLRNVYNSSGYHNAIDIEAAGGEPIYAARAGTVISADWKDAYGNMVILYHADLGVYTFYAHCSALNTYAGATVAQGEQIAAVGSTGNSSGNHLHFGICDTLLGGWPDVTYYDPLTYFTYDGVIAGPVEESCECSEEYAGIYTTKNVNTYLNIRSGHGSGFPVVGQIPAGAQVTVTKSDGTWAHVEYNGIKGYSSMDFLQKTADIEQPVSGMTIDGATLPEGNLVVGEKFRLRGVINSQAAIKRVWGGVYNSDGNKTSQWCEASPNTLTYDLAQYFDNKILFGQLTAGSYIYRIEAEDTNGTTFTLLESEFSETVPAQSYEKGDVNLDGEVSIADAVLLQNALLSRAGLSDQQSSCADVNSDGKITVFDLVIIKRTALSIA